MGDVRINGWVLVHDTDKQNVAQKGETLTNFRGETYTIANGCPPHKLSSTGRVTVICSDGGENTYYPQVFGMKWIVDNEPA
jgi:hypothetical protein